MCYVLNSCGLFPSQMILMRRTKKIKNGKCNITYNIHKHLQYIRAGTIRLSPDHDTWVLIPWVRFLSIVIQYYNLL